jgi:hypothetical protein
MKDFHVILKIKQTSRLSSGVAVKGLQACILQRGRTVTLIYLSFRIRSKGDSAVKLTLSLSKKIENRTSEEEGE